MPMALHRSCPKGMPMAKIEDRARGPGVLVALWMFYVYVLQSETSKTHYYGHSIDLDNRLKRHNAGKVRSTKGRRPWKIVYSEPFDTKSEAYKRELFFKSIEGYRFLKEKGII